MSPPLVELQGCAVRFGDTLALAPLSMQLQRGERLALVGSNGSGKTTLLRLSVWHNLMLALWLAGVPPAARTARAGEALQRVGLAGLQRRPARALSVGQQQRLALARAWAVRPQLLFLDEPTASLDPGARREVEALISEFADEGVTLVISTHHLGQARRLSRRVLCLDGGQVVADLPTERFFGAALPEAAARFVQGELP